MDRGLITAAAAAATAGWSSPHLRRLRPSHQFAERLHRRLVLEEDRVHLRAEGEFHSVALAELHGRERGIGPFGDGPVSIRPSNAGAA